MRLVGLKFVNSLGHPVKVSAVKLGEDKREYVYYFDTRPSWGSANYTMKLPKQTFIKRYRKSLDEFKKEK